MSYSTQLAEGLLESLKARPDVTVVPEPPAPSPDRPTSWYEIFAIETAISLAGTFQEGKPPFELELLKLLTDTWQQLARKKIKPADTCAALTFSFPYVRLVTYFESEGFLFAMYIASISAVEESNPGAAVARIGLALCVDSSLL